MNTDKNPRAEIRMTKPEQMMSDMFDLEQAIAEWRRRMGAAGIRSTTLLDELEGHLRQEIARLTRAGVGESEAFSSATHSLGQAGLLGAEFAKNGRLQGFLSKPRTLRIILSVNGMIGLIWLAGLSNILLEHYAEISGIFSNAHTALAWLIFAGLFAGSVLLTFESKGGRSIIRTGALLCLATWFIQSCIFACLNSREPVFTHGSAWDLVAEHGVLIAFLLVTIVILHLPERMNLKTTVKI